jgi:MFS transporter, DHA1 family, tetracycline resistance protein
MAKDNTINRYDEESKDSKEFSILPIFLVVLIDMIGIGIIIPVLTPLFLSTNIIFSALVPFAKRAIILGILIASYPLAQFFGSPILGALSDKHGRKKILIMSLIATFFGYTLFGIGILTHNLYILFISRIIDGFAGGSVTTAMSSIADISDEKTKVRRFGLVGMSFGLGMIIGPVIGGYLGDSSVVSWFNFATPFFFAALLCLINIILFIFQFKETLRTRKHSKISIFTGLKNIKKAFDYKELRVMFIFAFLFAFGFSFYTQFFQVFLIEKFNYTAVQIGKYFGFMGLCIAIAQGLIVRPLSKKFSPQEILPVSVLLVSIAIMMMLIPNHASGLYFIIPFLAVANGLTMPNMTGLISNITSREDQGEVLGVNQSVQALAMAIPPLIAGFFAAIYFVLPVIIGSLTILAAWLVFMIFFRHNQKIKCAIK